MLAISLMKLFNDLLTERVIIVNDQCIVVRVCTLDSSSEGARYSLCIQVCLYLGNVVTCM